MRNGIFVPAVAVRIAVGVLAAAGAAAMVVEVPALWRYLKIRAM
ncbi:DUF6893 family small protein [Streptomyces macrosporus]|uniref:Uncharacterized protein n=1 Tax=Streptomyces macrosporus TaxID=44032 RepID=A0ABN3K5H9_9ACTN